MLRPTFYLIANFFFLQRLQLCPSLTSTGSACLLVTLFGRGLLNTRSAGAPQKNPWTPVYKLATDVVGGADLDEALFSNLKQWKVLARSFCFAQRPWSVCVPCPCVTERLRNERNGLRRVSRRFKKKNNNIAVTLRYQYLF